MKELNYIHPKTAWFTTNKSCNNRCSWCYARESKFPNLSMDIERACNLVDELYDNNVRNIVFIGGEPSIYKHIIPLVSYIAGKKIRMSMATNGIRFADEAFAQQIIDSGLHNFNISLKGTNATEYYQSTKSHGFLKSIKGYKNLKSLGACVKLSYVIGSQTKSEINELKDFMEKYGLDNIVFQMYKPSAISGDDVPDLKIIAQTCKDFYDIFKSTNLHYAFEVSIPLCLLDQDLLNEMISKKIIQTCCHIRKGAGIIFDANFDILPCNHFINSPLNEQPVSTKDVLKFWNSETCTEFRRTINKYPAEKCAKCSMWRQCGGGCVLRWLYLNPNSYIK